MVECIDSRQIAMALLPAVLMLLSVVYASPRLLFTPLKRTTRPVAGLGSPRSPDTTARPASP